MNGNNNTFEVFVTEKSTVRCDVFRVRIEHHTDQDGGEHVWRRASCKEEGSTAGWYVIGGIERARLEALGAVFRQTP